MIEWCTGGPWFIETMFQYLNIPICEELFVTGRQGRYDLIYGLHDYKKENDNSTNATYFDVGKTVIPDSTKDSLMSLCGNIK